MHDAHVSCGQAFAAHALHGPVSRPGYVVKAGPAKAFLAISPAAGQPFVDCSAPSACLLRRPGSQPVSAAVNLTSNCRDSNPWHFGTWRLLAALSFPFLCFSVTRSVPSACA